MHIWHKNALQDQLALCKSAETEADFGLSFFRCKLCFWDCILHIKALLI